MQGLEIKLTLINLVRPASFGESRHVFHRKNAFFRMWASDRQPFESALQTKFAGLVHRNGSKICNKLGQVPLVSEFIPRDQSDRTKNQSFFAALTETWRYRAKSV